MFSVKDPVPLELRWRVVYKFLFAGCNACYIGETSRHLSTRVREHLSRDRNSHVYQHLQQSQTCRCLANKIAFPSWIVHSTNYNLCWREAMHIKWENPTLNKQPKHADLTLSFWYYSLSLFYIYVYIYFCSHNILCCNHCNYFNFYNFPPCIKCSARASVIPCLAHLKIVR